MKFKRNTKVYKWSYDILETTLECHTIIVDSYEYLDGMQWDTIDEYTCHYYIDEPYLKFFTKSVKMKCRVRGHMIHTDKTTAKLILLQKVLDMYGYLHEKTNIPTSNMIDVIKHAKREFNLLIDKYPEKVIAAQVTQLANDNNHTSIWF